MSKAIFLERLDEVTTLAVAVCGAAAPLEAAQGNPAENKFEIFNFLERPFTSLQPHNSLVENVEMPSRGNPNVPNKQRRIANRTKVQKRNAQNGIKKNARGTRQSTVLHPTSGPLAPVSGKKARKLEKAANHARQRAIEKALAEEGEVDMIGMVL